MGAWIETGNVRSNSRTAIMSHPVWVRGLKPQSVIKALKELQVAPCMGAWIETHAIPPKKHDTIESHPVWVRGLKQKQSRRL